MLMPHLNKVRVGKRGINKRSRTSDPPKFSVVTKFARWSRRTRSAEERAFFRGYSKSARIGNYVSRVNHFCANRFQWRCGESWTKNESDPISHIRKSQSWNSDNGCRSICRIDFPLKILVSQGENGNVWLSYNSPEYLRNRHQIPDDLRKNISGIEPIAESVIH
jgi:hypothetical protein